MAKSNSDNAAYKCTIFSPQGQHTLKGEVIEVSENNYIKFKYKKPRSSRYAIRVVAWADMIAYSDVSVSYRTPKAPVRTIGLATVEYEKNGMAKLTTDEKETIYVKTDCLDAMADDDSIQGGEKKKVSEKKKTKEKK